MDWKHIQGVPTPFARRKLAPADPEKEEMDGWMDEYSLMPFLFTLHYIILNPRFGKDMFVFMVLCGCDLTLF